MEKETKHTLEEGIIPFLLGSGTLDACWFGDRPKDLRPTFWWRKHLREYNDTLQTELSEMKKEREELIEVLQELFGEVKMEGQMHGRYLPKAMNKAEKLLSRISSKK